MERSENMELDEICDNYDTKIEINFFPFCASASTSTSDEVTGIPRITQPISYNEFFQQFMVKNKPCVISDFVTKAWPCLQTWVADDIPNFTFLEEKYGSSVVPVADCKQRYYNAQKKSTYKLSDYLKYWDLCISNSSSSDEILYLKDWHMTRDYPEAHEYSVPKYFASDWLNEYFSTRKDLNDDYRFVYMGPEDTWTPLHADVYSSFSWSVNVCGRKRWLLFPPGEEDCLRDNFGNLAYNAEGSELVSNPQKYPHYKNLRHSFQIIQEAGEAIFVPSGWHHQVWNLEHTISINHNWLNGCNILSMWDSLQQSLEAVQKEVRDCRDMDGWEQHCQIMLRATYGLNYEEFFGLLKHVSRTRLKMLEKSEHLVQSGSWALGKKHALWDLSRVYIVLNKILAEPAWGPKSYSNTDTDSDSPQILAQDIQPVIQEYSSLWGTCSAYLAT